MKSKVNTMALSMALVTTMALAGCGDTRTERALSGAGIGAGSGALIGAATGGSLAGGALIGGAVGAATGAIADKDQINLDR